MTAQNSKDARPLNPFDVFVLTQEKIDKAIKTFKARGDKDSLETAQMLESLPADFAKNKSQYQEMLGHYVKMFTDIGIKDAELYILFQHIIARVIVYANNRLEESFTPEEKEAWDNFYELPQNELQSTAFMEMTVLGIFGQTLDDYLTSCLVMIMNEISEEIKDEKELAGLINNLPIEKVDEINSLINESKFEEAFALIFKQ